MTSHADSPTPPAGAPSGAAWSPTQVGDQSGRTALVTGANSGLGLEVSAVLARAGARVVMTARSRERGETALAEVRRRAPGAQVELQMLDLASLASVADLATRMTASLGAHGLDLLVNNAGVMAVPQGRTADGFETQIGTNFLGHFALTGRLLGPLLQSETAGRRPRVVSLSSMAHRWGRITPDDLMREKRYGAWSVYGQSKLADLMFALELDRRTDRAARELVSVAAHPGISATNLFTQGPLGRLPRPVRDGLGKVGELVMQSPEMGAWPVLRAATAPDVVGGEYYGPAGAGERSGPPVRVGTSARAQDVDMARWLWDEAVRLTGVHYGELAPTT
ncbi:oxidoreductase [Pseudokineococcus lusitanus]|uniref:NAD(P)-dependent dehydrogenase (Short-subunit alcohol dehydrogenase family) n=1 Tax=Pseudokineococcus lusitanus TaxID=763993 RepID=A0A3N1HKY7_9ACTN|nr:oxidoreductase [Pseudokineococcus lusitanus]ROP43160.1 NAD(P)-dependent dehydrogenase (short-subunit alcohol dehydrogenase family) [Pseudokineococcus lusitanus]